MKVIDPGHIYELFGYDGAMFDRLKFMKRKGRGFPSNRTAYPGTNCQEVLRALIDRVEYLNKQIPHRHNERILDKLRQCIWLFEDRAAERHGRTFNALFEGIESLPTCLTCGHIECGGHE